MSGRDKAVSKADIENSGVVLFSVFSRYGDGITSFKIIREFISYYPMKQYIVITSPQLYPYARTIIRENIDIIYVNKRRNPLKLLKIIWHLKRAKVDLGFNPWSHGDESEFFITFAKKYSVYKKRAHYPKYYNVYDRVREYLLLKSKEVRLTTPCIDDGTIKNIVIAPFSTDVKKNLDRSDISALIEQLKNKFDSPDITIALPRKELQNAGNSPVRRLILGKSAKQSETFLKLLSTADLFIGVDAGPLHLADALGIRSIGIFGSNAVETFMDKDSNILPIRNEKLAGIFCFVASCTNPVCIHEMFKDDIFNHVALVDYDREITLEKNVCRLTQQ